jgi:hypothetical protein
MFRCSQSHHLQGAHYSCLLKLHFVKIVNYGASVCDGVAAHIGCVLVDVCMWHCSGVGGGYKEGWIG